MKDNFTNICIYGVGGVGGYFGGRIAEITGRPGFEDYNVSFIARGGHLNAIQQEGIVVKTRERVITAKPNLATDEVGIIPPPDLVLLCVKSYSLIPALASLKPVMKDDCVIIPLLNGVDIYDRIRLILNKGIVLPACVYLGTHIASPGVISQEGGDGVIIFGADSRHPDYTGENVKRFFENVGLKYDWQADPRPKIWEKYLFIASFGLVTAYTERSIGAVVANEEYKSMVRDIIGEIYSIAKAKGIVLPEDIIARTLQKAGNFPYEASTSFQRDIENKGPDNEGDLFGGMIIREGKAMGIPTPITELVYRSSG